MKINIKKVLLASVVVLLTPVAIAASNVVNVYNWSDYIDKQILSDFTKETGIKVVYDVFDSNELLETKMLAGGSGYDVVVPSASFLTRQIEAGAFQKLDKSKLPNIRNMWSEIEEKVAYFGDLNDYSVNYMWGTTGIGYNINLIKERMPNAPTDSLAMFFDPDIISKFADCGVHILNAPTEIIPAALIYIGEDPRTRDSSVIKKAGDVFAKVRPYIQKFHSSQYIDALANGDICLVMGWSGDVFLARDVAAEADNGVEIAYEIPKEGTQIWFDQLAIPTDARNVDNAYKFINWLMRPEQIASATNYVWYANGNLLAQKFVEEEILNDPTVYPTPEVMTRLYVDKPYDARTQRIITRTWTKITTGH